MKLTRVVSLLVTFCLFVFVSSAPADDGASPGVNHSQVQQLQQQMLGNSDIMALITALQGDPDIQAILSDPALVAAIQKEDAATLAADPRFRKLLNNPKIQAIVNQLR